MTLPALAQIGRENERYQTISLVRRGTFGKLYLCQDLFSSKSVFVKAHDLIDDTAESGDFKHSAASAREVALYRLLMMFPHPHIQGMLDYFVAQNEDSERTRFCMVFDFCPTDLWYMWKSPLGKARLGEAKRQQKYLLGTTKALVHLHALRMVHGDLSLEKVLISQADEPKLCDMSACFCAQTVLCSCQHQRCTRYVRSPEALFGSTLVQAETDTWALGVIAMALYIGRTAGPNAKPVAVFSVASRGASQAHTLCSSTLVTSDLRQNETNDERRRTLIAQLRAKKLAHEIPGRHLP